MHHEEESTFFDFELDPNLVEHANKFIIFSSDNDRQEMIDSIQYLTDTLPNIEVVSFHDYGHFIQRTLKDNKLPELLDAILA